MTLPTFPAVHEHCLERFVQLVGGHEGTVRVGVDVKLAEPSSLPAGAASFRASNWGQIARGQIARGQIARGQIARGQIARELTKTGVVIHLPEPPHLMWPTVTVRTSYLVGEQADCLLRGTPADWLGPASENFGGFVAERRGVWTLWGVPSTSYWYVSGDYNLGTLVIRHRLTPAWPKRGVTSAIAWWPRGAGRVMPPGCWRPGCWSAAVSASARSC